MSVNANIEPAPNMAEKSLLADMIQKRAYLSDEDQRKLLLNMIRTGMSNADRSESGPTMVERLRLSDQDQKKLLSDMIRTGMSNADRSESGSTMVERLRLSDEDQKKLLSDMIRTGMSNADRSESGPTMVERLRLSDEDQKKLLSDMNRIGLLNADRGESGLTMVERLRLSDEDQKKLLSDMLDPPPNMAEKSLLADMIQKRAYLSDEDQRKLLLNMIRTGMSTGLANQVKIGAEMRKLCDEARKIGLDYKGLGLTVSRNPDGMVLKLNHNGRQTHFLDVPQDVLEEKWPGLADRLYTVLEEENVLWQKRHFSIQEGRVEKIADEYPDLEISVFNCSDGMTLMVKHDGRQVNFDDMRFDVLEANWPGLSDRICEVFDDGSELQRKREIQMGNRIDPLNCSIVTPDKPENRNETPSP